MLISPILTVEEFKKIHNALCDLNQIVHQTEQILHPILHARLVKIRSEIESCLRASYEKDDAEYSRRQKHYDTIAEEISAKTIWSMPEIEDLNSKHPYNSENKLVLEYYDVTHPVGGDTWKDLWIAADKCIRETEDYHIFIENFHADLKRPGVIRLSTGS